MLLVKMLLGATCCVALSRAGVVSVVQYPPQPSPGAKMWDEDGDGIIGVAGKDYPNYEKVPKTSFECEGLLPGFYSDQEAGCQAFHLCERGRRTSFLCSNGTLFNQKVFTCDWWYQVECKNADSFYKLNELLYKAATPKSVLPKAQYPTEGIIPKISMPLALPKSGPTRNEPVAFKLLNARPSFGYRPVIADTTTTTTTSAYEEYDEESMTEVGATENAEYDDSHETPTSAPVPSPPVPVHPVYPLQHRHRYVPAGLNLPGVPRMG